MCVCVCVLTLRRCSAWKLLLCFSELQFISALELNSGRQVFSLKVHQAAERVGGLFILEKGWSFEGKFEWHQRKMYLRKFFSSGLEEMLKTCFSLSKNNNVHTVAQSAYQCSPHRVFASLLLDLDTLKQLRPHLKSALSGTSHPHRRP